MIVPAIVYSLSSQCFIILISTLRFICAVDHLIPLFLEMAYILFIGYRSMHLVLRILSNSNISIGLHRCYFFLSHELIITWYYRLYFIYVWVCLFLCSEHIELSLKGQIHSYLRQRDWFKNKPRRIEKKKKIDVNFYPTKTWPLTLISIPLTHKNMTAHFNIDTPNTQKHDRLL